MAGELNDPNYPLVGFYFIVNLDGDEGKVGFQEVSGISSRLETKVLMDGGRNNLSYKVPVKVTYDDLVLKRGLIKATSSFGKWCRAHLEENNSLKVEPKTVTVHLLDPDRNPLITWNFRNTYPVKWDVSGFNGKSSEIVIETLTLTYSNFKIL